MKDLIAKLEGLTGPDREVDAEISFYVEGTCFGIDFWKKYYGPDDPVDLATGRESLKTVSLRSFWQDDCDAPPAFTESTDAALGLVPEGWMTVDAHQVHKEFCATGETHGDWKWTLMGPGEWSDADPHRPGWEAPDAVGKHKYPAIALCIAALKTIAAEEG